jgi:hypothetical protein
LGCYVLHMATKRKLRQPHSSLCLPPLPHLYEAALANQQSPKQPRHQRGPVSNLQTAATQQQYHLKPLLLTLTRLLLPTAKPPNSPATSVPLSASPSAPFLRSGLRRRGFTTNRRPASSPQRPPIPRYSICVGSSRLQQAAAEACCQWVCWQKIGLHLATAATHAEVQQLQQHLRQ